MSHQARAIWTVRGGAALDGGRRGLIAGIVNVTPDSFFDGGRFAAPQDAVAHGLTLLAAGADLLDVGGQSTRPGAAPVGADEEIARAVPVVAQLSPRAPVSIDTFQAAVAAAALDAGAVIVNDVSACRFDPTLADVLAQYKPGYVLMHSQGRPQTMQAAPRYDDVVGEILAFFEERLAALTAAGLPEERIVLDPGVGFGKTLAHNLAIMRGVERFFVLGRPLCLGVSNKSWIGELYGPGADHRPEATQAASALLAAKGVAVHRVHDVAGAARALTLAWAIAGERP
ncbi:MAG: dihydropteroate synthase [Desulfovibrionaceae bacterium]|nr:dihydropteroate synthase [Desulfovibrionaceae bacterium]MBF0513572.1 dihydropteroate synthase [Desulfovibrionaceae bacterium]